MFRVKFGVEIIGDPYDVLISLRSPFRILASAAKAKMQWEARRSALASYVTSSYLQQRYPSNSDHNYSSIDLGPEFHSDRGIREFADGEVLKLLSIGSLAQLYKGPDILIRALAHLKSSSSLKIHATWLGTGRHLDGLREMANRKGVIVEFTGDVQGKSQVIQYLAEADLFVLPSRTEGLPRAMIEAMASGLPCIGTKVGGIPELLPADALVPAEDFVALAGKIRGPVAGKYRALSEEYRS